MYASKRASYKTAQSLSDVDRAFFVLLGVIALLAFVGVCIGSFLSTPIYSISGTTTDARRDLVVTNSATIRASGCTMFSFTKGSDIRKAEQLDVVPNEVECDEYFELNESFPVGTWTISTEKAPGFWDFLPDDVLIKNQTHGADVIIELDPDVRLFTFFRYFVVAMIGWLGFSIVIKGAVALFEIPTV